MVLNVGDILLSVYLAQDLLIIVDATWIID